MDAQNLKITNQDIDDIVCTALEGGITYWCDSADVIEDEYYGEYASDQISRGGSLSLRAMWGDGRHMLNRDKLLKGICAAIKAGYGANWYEDGVINVDMIDAEAADIIIQYALWGEIVYG